jgi:hypothetical protein
VGGALIVPLSHTLCPPGMPASRRNATLGIWGALGGLAVARGISVLGAVLAHLLPGRRRPDPMLAAALEAA